MESGTLNFSKKELKYTGVVGTGGIGSGQFFVINGDHTLGREESRSGRFLDVRDYCKLHIILHYVKVLLGSDFEVIPIGKVGDDDIGHRLHKEMRETGFVMKWILMEPGIQSLFSFCFQYPDLSGGNLTINNSASSLVNEPFIRCSSAEIKKFGSKGIVVAAPEVPIAARIQLLEMGRRNGLFCTASFTTGEISSILRTNVFANIDLLALNIDEASAVCNMPLDNNDPQSTVISAIEKLQHLNKNMMVSITAGKSGSWCWDGIQMNRFLPIKSNVVRTAGAGDAFYSGLIIGQALGLPLFDGQQLASLIAGSSIESPHTINHKVNRSALHRLALSNEHEFSTGVLALLEPQ